ncbi:MAG: ABC transporter permease, partial [Comamonadaceae bacterium]
MRDHASLFFLFRQLLGRELFARYRATTLGALWLVLQPLMMLAVYTVVFSGIFKVRWAGAEGSAGFALVLFAGLIVFNFFAEVLVSAPALVTSQPNFVKKVVFPVEMLATVRVASALSTALISLCILFSAQAWLGNMPSPWFGLAPLVLLEMLPMLLGLAWLISALGVYLQDVAQIAGVL